MSCSDTRSRNRASYQAYDYATKVLVAAGNATVAKALAVPRSTWKTWRGKGVKQPKTHEVLDWDRIALQAHVLDLQAALRQAEAKIELLTNVADACGWSLRDLRVPGGEAKQRIIDAIDRGRADLPIREIQDLIGLTPQRLSEWNARARACRLDDASSCPKRRPTRATRLEAATVVAWAKNPDYRHMPTTTLARHAAREGSVFLSPSTWLRILRNRGIRRPRNRRYPQKPKVGLRATEPNEYWHIDVTIMRLFDGTRAYIQTLIDNFSRFILAWRITARFLDLCNKQIILDAIAHARRLGTLDAAPPTLITDAGCENVNHDIDTLIGTGAVARKIAQIEITFSNSISEALNRSLKHNWLFLHDPPAGIPVLQGKVDFYYHQHNYVMPHSALAGATPEEVYLGQWSDAAQNAFAREYAEARQRRIAFHRQLQPCDVCTVKPP